MKHSCCVRWVSSAQCTELKLTAAGTEPCNPVFEDDDCACIIDGNPQSPLHFLVFPKDRTNLSRLSSAGVIHERLLGHMVLVAKVAGTYMNKILHF